MSYLYFHLIKANPKDVLFCAIIFGNSSYTRVFQFHLRFSVQSFKRHLNK